jgi:hypothetical protein
MIVRAFFVVWFLPLMIAWGQEPRRQEPVSEARAGRPGPWDQDVAVWRVGRDGIVERLGVFERAGVATLARLKDGRLIAAHQHFPADSAADFDKVAVHFSEDDGRNWTRPQVIQLTGLPEGMRFPFDPTLVPLPDGQVRLYFTSLRGRQTRQSVPGIYSALSKDGIHYEFEPGMRFGIDGRRVIDCAVVLHRGVFHLFAPDNGAAGRRSEDSEAMDGRGYHAVSDDGLNFRRVDDVQIEGRHRQWLGCAQSDGQIITFYGTGDGVWTASSEDGASWKPGSTLGIRGADPGMIALPDGSLVLVGTTAPRPGTRSDRVP